MGFRQILYLVRHRFVWESLKAYAERTCGTARKLMWASGREEQGRRRYSLNLKRLAKKRAKLSSRQDV